MYVPQDYYETIKTLRKLNKLILTKMKGMREYPLEESIHKGLKNTNG